MNKPEKRRFIRDLIANVQKDVLAKVDLMPAEWDGVELREYVAHKFQESTLFAHRPDMRHRASDYRNEVITRNL